MARFRLALVAGWVASWMLTATALAHDTWVEASPSVARVGDAARIDLLLGNHGNNHRDFKLAGKLKLDGATLRVIAPDGQDFDLRDRLIDTGYAPQEGFWTATFGLDVPGTYMVAHTYDKVVAYAPERTVKSAKTFVIASPSVDLVPLSLTKTGFDRVLGHPLELVPVRNPVVPAGPGMPIRVRLLFQGQPLAGANVAFIPRGAVLEGERDGRYERTTDEKGEASYEPNDAGTILIVAHRDAPKESGTLNGQSYEFTKYSAAMTVLVPRLCPCCGD